MSRSQAHRLNRREEQAVQDATRAWAGGLPHEAIMILASAGMREHIPAFVRTCHREAVNRRKVRLRHRYE
jgi:hypothetical protein